MMTQIGRSTDSATAGHRDDVSGNEVASFRYYNPGAQYPSARAARFGQTGYGIIGGGHKIARFPSPVNGAAANFDLLSRSYVGMTIGEAGTKWTGAHGFGVPGYNSDAILTKAMVEVPTQAIPLLKAIANRESGKGNNLTEEQWRQAHRMFKAGSADAYLDGLSAQVEIALPADGKPTGAGLLSRARQHIGEPYINTQVPKNDPDWHGPWDCAEFISWLVFQEAGILYGCVDDKADPAKADAYTGAWKADLEREHLRRVSVEEAAATVGGILLRYPPGPGKMGHIALCDGKGGTVEAKGRRYGVVADTVDGREWHTGVLIPEINYGAMPPSPIKVTPPAIIYQMNAPNMSKATIIRIQEALAAKGFDPGDTDGEFGPNTQAALIRFQEAEGMVVDGAVGSETASALGISLVGESTDAAVGLLSGASIAGSSTTPLPGDGQQLLPLILMMLLKEKPMADAKPGQGLELLLPLLLQSALTGKQIDIAQILAMLSTGKPLLAQPINTLPASAVQTPINTVPAQVAQPVTQTTNASADLIQLLVPVLYERITNKPWPGTEQKTDTPTNANVPVLSRPSVQLSAGALGIVTLLQAFGKVGMPFNLGDGAIHTPTTTGTLSTLIPLIAGAVGATGGWGALAGVAAKLLGGIVGAIGKKA